MHQVNDHLVPDNDLPRSTCSHDNNTQALLPNLLLLPAAAAALIVSQSKKLGQGALIGPRTLPPSTVEQLGPLFLQQLAQQTSILNRPEVPHLTDHPLLIRAYDQGLVDASGAVDSGRVYRMLEEGGVGPFRGDGFFGYAESRVVQVRRG